MPFYGLDVMTGNIRLPTFFSYFLSIFNFVFVSRNFFQHPTQKTNETCYPVFSYISQVLETTHVLKKAVCVCSTVMMQGVEIKLYCQ